MLSTRESETTTPSLPASLKSGGAAFVPNRGAKKEAHCANGAVRASPLHLVLKVALMAAYLCKHAAQVTGSTNVLISHC
jgi:hypothetical protein